MYNVLLVTFIRKLRRYETKLSLLSNLCKGTKTGGLTFGPKPGAIDKG